MRMPNRDAHMAPRRSPVARVQLHCPALDTHMRQLILEQATIYADGWGRWVEEGHVHMGSVQTGVVRNNFIVLCHTHDIEPVAHEFSTVPTLSRLISAGIAH